MKVELTEMLWLEEHRVLTESELVEATGLSDQELKELTDYGVLVPAEPEPRTFSAKSIMVARKARRLRKDFGLNADGLALAMTLLDQIRKLEMQVSQLQAHLPSQSR